MTSADWGHRHRGLLKREKPFLHLKREAPTSIAVPNSLKNPGPSWFNPLKKKQKQECCLSVNASNFKQYLIQLHKKKNNANKTALCDPNKTHLWAAFGSGTRIYDLSDTILLVHRPWGPIPEERLEAGWLFKCLLYMTSCSKPEMTRFESRSLV